MTTMTQPLIIALTVLTPPTIGFAQPEPSYSAPRTVHDAPDFQGGVGY